ncbi:MAG: hypothetical protein ACFB0G_24375 [Leptolyngbyaceae cyanobacterium]
MTRPHRDGFKSDLFTVPFCAIARSPPQNELVKPIRDRPSD